MPKVKNSSFINSNIATKEKVLLMPPVWPNRIFAGYRKYPKYPSQLILEKLSFEVNYPTNLNS